MTRSFTVIVCLLVSFALLFCCWAVAGERPTPSQQRLSVADTAVAPGTYTPRQPAQIASLRPQLVWQRVPASNRDGSMSEPVANNSLEGPILYQLVFRFVNHDSTLTGNGSMNSPLAIAAGGVGTTQLAAGAVTFSKLAFGNASNGQVLVADGAGAASWQTVGTGSVTNVSASAPLNVTNGTTAPNISLTGIVGVANGGTGLNSAGAAGNFLRSNGSAWASGAIQTSDLPSLSGSYVDLSSTQTIGGNKTFSNLITGNISGNAATATTATTAGNALALGGNLANLYSTTLQSDARYLQLSGGTLTGGLSGTSANFTGTGSFGGSLTAAGGTVFPALGTATGANGFNSNTLDLTASSFNPGSGSAVNQLFRWQAEPVNNNSNNATGKLNLLFAHGALAPGETGLSIADSGVITFAPGQTFPGTGPGTVTSVSAAAPLSVTNPTSTPSISLSGIVGIASGGTGISTSPSAAGQYLRSSGANTWSVGSISAGDLPSLSGTYVDLVSNQSVAGNKTFTQTVSANVTAGNGVSATTSNVNGIGLLGLATDTTGTGNAIGVQGLTASPTGTAVFGHATDTSATGGTAGVQGTSDSPNGFGVFGQATNTTNTPNNSTTGVWGVIAGPNGFGVNGVARDTTGNGFVVGVRGVVLGPSGNGVRGVARNAASAGGAFVNTDSTCGTSATCKLIEGQTSPDGGNTFNDAFRVLGSGAVQAAAYQDLTGNPISITNVNIADGSLTPAKIAGTAAILGANNFTGNQAVTGNESVTGTLGLGTAAPLAKLDIAVNGGHVLAGDAGCFTPFTGIGFGNNLSFCANYSLAGNGTDTIINRPTGGNIFFRENNSTEVYMPPGGGVISTPTGNSATAVAGYGTGPSGSGVWGFGAATGGSGVIGEARNAGATAGVFINIANGKILSGQVGTSSPPTEVFSVAGNGALTAGNGIFTGTVNVIGSVNAASLSGDGSALTNLRNTTIQAQNETTVGTFNSGLAKLTTDNPSKAVATHFGDKSGAIGIVVAGSGQGGTATIAVSGPASCVFENAVTAGDYVTIGRIFNAECFDFGSSYPSGEQVIGRAMASGPAGTYPIDLFGTEARQPAVYNYSGAFPISNYHTTTGGIILDGTGNATVTLAGSAAFSSNNFICTASDNGNAGTISPVAIGIVSANQIFIRGGASRVVQFICIGN